MRKGEKGEKGESRYFSTAARMDEALIECLEKKELEYITVKEICEKAGVNRSTFYLHYETIADLLNECVEYTNNKCFRRYTSELADVKSRISSGSREDMIFISPEYLRPFFEFVCENKRLFKVILLNPKTFETDRTFRRLFDEIFSPAMDKFNIPEKKKPYMIHFYLGGIIAMVEQWIKNDCSDNVEDMIRLCIDCVTGNFGLPDEKRQVGE